MKWYLAKLVFRILCGGGLHTPQFEEQLRLVQAEDALDAFNKAQKMGEAENNARKLAALAGVEWRFLDVTELYPVDIPGTGAEVFSRVYEQEDGHAHQNEVRRKAGYLISHCTEQFLSTL
jgi:hypothetical protein